MKKLSELKDFHGIDKSNDVSLYDYGLLCKKRNEIDIQCWVGVEIANDGYYSKFDSFHTNEKDLKEKMNEDWFNKKCFLEYVEQTEEEFLSSNFVNQIHSMLLYHGYENIFGSSYFPIEIENE
jgi:hypothetical protein